VRAAEPSGATRGAIAADPVGALRGADTLAPTPTETYPGPDGATGPRPAGRRAPSVTVGVLALQGAVREHLATLDRLGLSAVEVRHPDDLAGVDGLIIPGGESTAISMLIESAGLREPLAERLDAGMPAFGTCAGMILLATDVADGRPDQHFFAAIDIGVRRNAFGRQVDSFETDLAVGGLSAPLHAVFIRAPIVERVGPGVEVLATVDGFDGGPRPVVCRQGPVLVAAFHPELTSDTRLHELFVSAVVKAVEGEDEGPAAGGQDDGTGEAASGAGRSPTGQGSPGPGA
jgi:pyridoxal 5'-phosphate synthase pdxT subunit